VSDSKRFNMTMPQETFDDLEEIAKSEGRPVVDVVRRFISLGLLVKEAQTRGAEILIRESGKEDRLIVIL